MAETQRGATKTSPEGARFEEALAELDAVVRRLERGELGLEDSLAAFEHGMELVRHLSQRLADVEQRVELLLKSEGGQLTLQALDDEE
jgi:exodeoxyribonuclease VII small subunit